MVDIKSGGPIGHGEASRHPVFLGSSELIFIYVSFTEIGENLYFRTIYVHAGNT